MKTTITRVNVALTVIVQPLFDVAMHDSHSASIAGKRKRKKDSIYLLTRAQVSDEILFQALQIRDEDDCSFKNQLYFLCIYFSDSYVR